jgi:hypothetical protein
MRLSGTSVCGLNVQLTRLCGLKVLVCELVPHDGPLGLHDVVHLGSIIDPKETRVRVLRVERHGALDEGEPIQKKKVLE